MSHDEGGGASRTTDPASGSSAATDVSLRELMAHQFVALDRHLTSELAALRRETQTAQEAAAKAIEVAHQEASERLAAHNGLIEQMRQQAGQFATRESLEDYKDAMDKRLSRNERFQASLIGGMVLASTIGVANLVKVWSG